MKKIAAFFALLGITINVQAFTITYNCTDRNDGVEMYFNIDENSLHYEAGKGNFYLFNFDKTIKAKNKSLVHMFSKGTIHYSVHQKPSNPIDIYIDDYKDNKLRYEYKCKLDSVLGGNDKIPVTFITIENSKKMLSKVAGHTRKK